MAIVSLINMLITLYAWIILARVLISWLPLPGHHPIMRTFGPPLYALTEPVLAPIRRVLRPYMGSTPIDFSPLVAYFGLMIVRALLISIVYRFVV